MINAYRNKSFVSANVIDPIGNGFTEFFIDEIMDFYLTWLALWCPFLATIFMVSENLFFLCIDGDDWISSFLECSWTFREYEETAHYDLDAMTLPAFCDYP